MTTKKKTPPRPSITVTKRKLFGRKVKQLRREKKLPANIFGHKIKSTAITLDAIEFEKLFRKAGETGLIELNLTGSKSSRPVLVSHVQYHPISDRPLHVDFHQVDLTEKVTASVPVKIKGESPAVKDKGAILVTIFNEIEVEALPTDLPDQFEVEVNKLVEFGDSIHIKDLKVASGVEVKLGEDETIVTIQEPKKEEVEEKPEAEPEAAPEGEAPPEEKAVKEEEKGKKIEAEKQEKKKPKPEKGEKPKKQSDRKDAKDKKTPKSS